MWQDEARVDFDFTDTVPVLFAVPAECPETNSDNPHDRILWQLEATARLPGVDYVAQFEVPVFHVKPSAQTGEQIEASEHAQLKRQAGLADFQPPPDFPIRVEWRPDGSAEFFFPPARNRRLAVLLTAFWVLWTGLLVVVIYFGAPILFDVAFALADVVVLYSALNEWFSRHRVVVDRNGITFTGGLFGVGSRTMPASDIADVTGVTGATAQAGMALILYCDIQIKLRSGGTLVAARGIEGSREAHWLAGQMLCALGR